MDGTTYGYAAVMRIARTATALLLAIMLATRPEGARATNLNVDAMIACAVGGGLDSFAMISALQHYGRYCRNINSVKDQRTHHDESSDAAEKEARLEALANQYSIFGSATDNNYTGSDVDFDTDGDVIGNFDDTIFGDTFSTSDSALVVVGNPPLDALDSCCLQHERCYSSLSLLASTQSNSEMLAHFGSYNIDCSFERYSMTCDKVRQASIEGSDDPSKRDV